MSASADNDTQARRRLVALGITALVAVGAVAVYLVVLSSDEEPAFIPARGISVRAVLADPGRYAGEEITVIGTADVVTDIAMSLGEGDLIVIAADPSEQNFQRQEFFAGDRVRATGTLRISDARGVVRSLPDRSLLPSQFQEFARQPVLLADRLERASSPSPPSSSS